MTKSSTTPIVMLTLQDLRDVIREEMGSSVNVTHESETPSTRPGETGREGSSLRSGRHLQDLQL